MFRTLMLFTTAIAGVALAQAPPGAVPQSFSMDDKFAMDAMSGGMYEVQASKLAMQRSTNADVKKIAEKIVADHTKANQELTGILTRTKPNLVREQMMPIHAMMYQKLSAEQGADFDDCYLCQQVLAHQEALMCFRKEAKKGQDKDLKAFAEKTIPALREHMDHVRNACEYARDDGKHETLKPGENK